MIIPDWLKLALAAVVAVALAVLAAYTLVTAEHRPRTAASSAATFITLSGFTATFLSAVGA